MGSNPWLAEATCWEAPGTPVPREQHSPLASEAEAEGAGVRGSPGRGESWPDINSCDPDEKNSL